MSTIGNPSDKFSSPGSLDKEHPSASDDRLADIFNSALSSSAIAETGSIKDKASAAIPTEAAKVADHVKSAAAGAGITPSDSPLFIKQMTYVGKPLTGFPYMSNYEVRCLRGLDLGTTVDSSVRALAAKDIPLPLPLPFSMEEFAEAKAKMEAVLVDDSEKRIFKKVTGALLHITFDDLILGIRELIPQFNEAIGTTPFSAVVMKGKSNEWVTQIAIHEGLKYPHKLSILKKEIDDKAPAYHSTVLIIDDGSYSGQQITLIMNSLCTSSEEKTPLAHPPIKKFFVFVPYMTTEARDCIIKKASELNVDVEILSKGTMPTYHEVLTKAEAMHFRHMAFFPNYEVVGSTLSFTDWRRPDEFSSPLNFLDGKMNYTAADGKQQVYKGDPLVPEILGPYKLTEKVNYSLSKS